MQRRMRSYEGGVIGSLISQKDLEISIFIDKLTIIKSFLRLFEETKEKAVLRVICMAPRASLRF